MTDIKKIHDWKTSEERYGTTVLARASKSDHAFEMNAPVGPFTPVMSVLKSGESRDDDIHLVSVPVDVVVELLRRTGWKVERDEHDES